MLLNNLLISLLLIKLSLLSLHISMPAFRALRKLVNDQQNNWDLYLEPTLFSLRSKVHTTTKYTPFFLMYGREAVFPSEVPAQVPVSVCQILSMLELRIETI